jgi:hypothetical protein
MSSATRTTDDAFHDVLLALLQLHGRVLVAARRTRLDRQRTHVLMMSIAALNRDPLQGRLHRPRSAPAVPRLTVIA